MMPRLHPYYYVLAALVLIAGFIYALSLKVINPPATQSAASMLIRIAVPDMSLTINPSSGVALVDHLYLNQTLDKEFAKDNIQIQWHFVKGAGPAINEALANGQLDVAFLGDLPMIVGRANGLDTKLVMAISRKIRSYLAVVPHQGFNDFEALKGKKIAIWKGTANQLSFNSMLKHQGYTEKDFKLINLDPAAGNAALVAGRVDALWGTMHLLALEKQGVADIVLSSADSNYQAGTFQSGVVIRNEFIQKNPKIVQRIVNSILQSSYWVSDATHRDDAMQLVAKQGGFSRDLLDQLTTKQQFNDIHSPLLDSFFINNMQHSAEDALAAGLIRQPVKMHDWIDDRFVKQGIATLGYTQVWTAQ